MKLKEYIKNLQEVEKKFGGDLDVIYAEDDEGNNYGMVHYTPCLAYYSGNYKELGYIEPEEIVTYNMTDPIPNDVNAICIN